MLEWLKALFGASKVEKAERGTPLSANLSINRRRLSQSYGNSADVIIRELKVGPRKIRVLLVLIDGLVDKTLIAETVMKPLANHGKHWKSPRQAFTELKQGLLPNIGIRATTTLENLLGDISRGGCGILIDGVAEGLISVVPGWVQRNPGEPDTEPVIRGPKEGFVESIRTNTSIIRRRIRDPRLRIEEYELGRTSWTRVAIVYIEGLASQDVLGELRSRINRIDVDGINESGQIEELIEDGPFSPFPTILRTERPDRVTGGLLEGRIAILTDGTPFVLILPATFTMFFTTPEDYHERYWIGAVLRLLRFVSFFASLVLPGLYVAILTFHQEMMPTALILSIAAQREGVPFPGAVETFLMELTFELLREAGTRLPRLVGPAISIIGALVLGDAAIRAGLVSPAMVVVVAFTGIASFSTPLYSMAIGARILRFALIILGGTLGLFGIIAGLFALLIHLCTLRSFGTPFLEPLAPVVLSDWKDALVRLPWWAMRTRPRLLGVEDPIRQVPGLEPMPPREEG
ncbi:MAG: spore germination protein [Limnochordia bacterium]